MFRRRTNRYLFSLITSLLLVGCGSSEMGKAQDFVDAGMYSEAITILEAEIQSNPKNEKAHYLLGIAFLGTGEQDNARRTFLRASRLDSSIEKEIGEAYREMGAHFLGQDNAAGIRRGYQYLEEAIRTNSELTKNAAMSYRDKGIAIAETDLDLSRELLRRGLELEPSFARDDKFYYMFHIVTNRDSESKSKTCEEFLSLFPESGSRAEVLFWLGNHEMTLKNYSQSAVYLKEIVEQFPNASVYAKAKVMLVNIEEIRDSQEKAELEKVESIKRAELEQAERLKQMEIEKAKRLKQIELEQAEKRTRHAIAEQRMKLELESRIHKSRGAFLDYDGIVDDGRHSLRPLRGKKEAIILSPISATKSSYVEMKCYVPEAGATLVSVYCSAQDDCPPSDFVAQILLLDNENEAHFLSRRVVKYSDGWVKQELSLSAYSDQVVRIRFIAKAGGVKAWCSEWAGLTTFYVLATNQ